MRRSLSSIRECEHNYGRGCWEPGTAQGYHAASMGWIVGEVVRRVSGRTIGRLFADEVAAPLGLDLWIGIPEEEEFRYGPFVEFDPRMRAQLRARLAGG